MTEEKRSTVKEPSSLDVVQLESSDDDLEDYDLDNDYSPNRKNESASSVSKNGKLVPFTNSLQKGAADDEEDIDSEEERDILKGIRDEIESKVREEMKDEINSYQTRLLAIEAGQLPEETGGDTSKEENGADQGEMDPQLKEAFVKMQKLDRILRKKVKREREVKRDRLILEKRLKDEISAMQHGASHYREIKINTEKFLALAPPPSHNEGVTLDYGEADDITPLFQTEIDDCEIKTRSRRKHSMKDGLDTEVGDESQNRLSSDDETRSRADTSASGEGARKKGSKKNFIKRNKELAAAANETIAMTDDEKKRVQDLLGDLDDLPEEEDGLMDGIASSVFQLALNPGDGFVPDDIELKSLTNIDERLKYIMPEDEYLSIQSRNTSQHTTPRPALFTRVGVRSTAALLDGFGEQVLYETKEERELKARLDSIEKKLEMFKAPQEAETDRSDHHLSDEQLDDLLKQCARSMSRASVMETPDSSARSEVSSRQVLMENPPKLSEEQLQQLLSEAYFPMSSQLAALTEDAVEDEDSISAETWKTIMNERLEDDTESGPSSRNSQNLSNNAHFENGKHWNGPYRHDKLLPDESERVQPNSYSEFSDDPPPPRLGGNSRSSKSKEFQGLPKISSSSNLNSKGHQLPSDNFDGSQDNSMSFSSSRYESDSRASSTTRLPSISSNSFLIHASQGLNDEPMSGRGSVLSSREQPLLSARNDLKDMSVTSFSDETWDQGLDRDTKHLHRVPRPPPTSQ